ncbi:MULTISPECIES: helix-turn-helix transcriptional regulator [Enterobacter]|uniref:helix-turn-helix domain-containing protein n=1 Tax=Enterobacter TaxID=547 RepID=UPI0018728DAF|nr:MULTISPECIES: helix-turn-helix transcriptional regulator [Enterobacter]MBE4834429.1 helix-turn-helix transcriptional regulator [Enterobacter cloacae complex sp. P47BA]HDS9724646.1 helix-turn-helix transcriptional regulator [Enterobacter bugandensis]
MKNVYPIKILTQLRPMLLGFRKANGLTRKDVSERLGVTQQTYARLEANPASASIERLFKVFTVLGVEISLSSMANSSEMMPSGENKSLENLPARQEKW